MSSTSKIYQWGSDASRLYPKNRDVKLDTAAGKDVFGASFSSMMSKQLYGEFAKVLSSPRLFYAWTTPATTEVDLSGSGNTGTYQAFTTADQVAVGSCWTMLGDGSTKYVSIADSDTLSFGDGTNDSPFSVGGWVNLTDSANKQIILAKWNQTATTREWTLNYENTERLRLYLYDEDANKTTIRAASGATTVGWRFVVATYSGLGGASAGDGAVLYVDGAAITSTATNDANYVSMVNTNSPVYVGAREESGMAGFFASNMGCVFVEGSELTAAEIKQLYLSTRGFYKL